MDKSPKYSNKKITRQRRVKATTVKWRKQKNREAPIASSAKSMFTEVIAHTYFSPSNIDCYDRVCIDIIPAIYVAISNQFPQGKTALPVDIAVHSMIASLSAMLFNLIRGAHFGDASASLVNVQYAGSLLVNKDLLSYLKTIAVPKTVYIQGLETSIIQLIRIIEELSVWDNSKMNNLGQFIANLLALVDNIKLEAKVCLSITKELKPADLVAMQDLSEVQKQQVMTTAILTIAQSQAILSNYAKVGTNSNLFSEFKVNNRVVNSVVIARREGCGFSFISWDNTHAVSEEWLKVAIEAPIFLDYFKVMKKNKLQLYDIIPDSYGALKYWDLPVHLVHNEEGMTIEEDNNGDMVDNFKPSFSGFKLQENTVLVQLNAEPLQIQYPHMSLDMIVAYSKNCDKVVFCRNTNAVVFMQFQKQKIAIAVADKDFKGIAMPRSVNARMLATLKAEMWATIFDKADNKDFKFV